MEIKVSEKEAKTPISDMTKKEILELHHVLTNYSKYILSKYGIFGIINGYSPDDFSTQAITKVLGEERKLKNPENIVLHMKGIVKSIIWNEFRKYKSYSNNYNAEKEIYNHAHIHEDDTNEKISSSKMDNIANTYISNITSDNDIYDIARRFLKEIQNDDISSKIIRELISGDCNSYESIAIKLKISPSDVNNAIKRIRRKYKSIKANIDL